MAEVLRAEAKTAGSSQRACKPRTYSAAPLVGAPAGSQRSGSGGEKEGQRSAMQFSALAGNGADFAPTQGPGPQARRSLVTFHRWKVTRRRRDQKTNTNRVTRKRHKRNKNCPPPLAQAVFEPQKENRNGFISRHKTAQKSEQ